MYRRIGESAFAKRHQLRRDHLVVSAVSKSKSTISGAQKVEGRARSLEHYKLRHREYCFGFITSRYGDSECSLVAIGGD